MNSRISKTESDITTLKTDIEALKVDVDAKREECKPLSKETNAARKTYKKATKEEKKDLKTIFQDSKKKSNECQKELKTLVKKLRRKKARMQNRKKGLKKLQNKKQKRKKKRKRNKDEVMKELVAGQCVADHVCAAIRGDPHITTFDGFKYDCQGEGEFVLAKTVNSDSTFEVQGRFVSIGRPDRTVSITKAVSITTGVEGDPDVDVFTEMEDDVCNLYYYANGEPTDFSAPVPGISFEGNGDDSTDKADYLFFTNSGVMYTVYAKKGNFGCVLNSKICLPPAMVQEEDIVGLLGTPDGIDTNEWTTPSGAKLQQKKGDKQAGYAMCTQHWCVRDAQDSIFGYLPETQHSDFNNCDAPYNAAGDDYVLDPPDECEQCCSNHPVQELYDECVEECAMAEEGFGVEQCVIDMEDAVLLADVEKKCQDPVIPEEPERSGALDLAMEKEEEKEEAEAETSSTCHEEDGGFTESVIDGATCYTGSSAAVTCACNDPALGNGTCCQGDLACHWPTKRKGEDKFVTICQGSCNGDKACMMEKKQKVTIHPGSCNELRACFNIGQGQDFRNGADMRCRYKSCDKEVGRDSCNGDMSCSNARGEVGDGSCDGLMSCMYSDAMIGHNACTEDHACTDADEDVQDNVRRLL